MKKKMLICVTLVLVLICCMLGTVGVFAGDNVFAVFQDAASLNSWTCPGGVTASFDAGENAAKFSVDTAGGVKRISYNQADLVFSKGARYHVSYKIKSPGNGSYFLGLELNEGNNSISWKLAPNGSGSSVIYDNTYRGGGANGSTDWVNISYDLSVYDIKNGSGVSIDSVTIPANKFFFQFNSTTDYYIKDFKIEKIPFVQQGNVLVNTIFEDNFEEASLHHWNVSGGTLSVDNGAFKFVGSSGRIEYTGKNVKFGNNTKYRISYRTKITYDKAYFMGLEIKGLGKWQYAFNGSFADSIYDNTADFRGTSRNMINGAITDDWADVSYEITMYDIQDTSGASIDSVNIPANKLFFNLPHADTTFYIDYLKIEEILENVGISYDSTMGTVSIDGASVANGARLTAAKASVSAQAKSGYLFNKFVVIDRNGETTEYPASDSVDMVFDSDSTVTAVFESAPAPSVAEGTILADLYQNENSILFYSSVLAQGKPVSEFGIELKKTGGSESIRLEGMSEISETNNRFGIRAYGAGITAGSYEARAYAVIDGEFVTANWKTIVIPEKENSELLNTFKNGFKKGNKNTQTIWTKGMNEISATNHQIAAGVF